MNKLKIITFLAAWFFGSSLVFAQPEEISNFILEQRAAYKKQLEHSKKPFETKVVRKGDKPVKVTYDISGAKRLCLLTNTTPDGYHWDYGVLVNAKLTDKDGKETWATDVEWIKAKSRTEPLKNLNFSRKQIKIKGEPYEHGISLHAPGVVILNLHGKYEKFEALCGIEDEAGKRGSVVFKFQEISPEDYLAKIKRKYPEYFALAGRYYFGDLLDLVVADDLTVSKGVADELIGHLEDGDYYRSEFNTIGNEEASMAKMIGLIEELKKCLDLQEKLKNVNIESIGLAINDLSENPSFDKEAALKKYAFLKKNLQPAIDGIYKGDANAEMLAHKLIQAKREILLNKAVLDFDEMLVINQKLKDARTAMAPELGTEPANWKSLLSSSKRGFNAEIQKWSKLTGEIQVKTIYKPESRAALNGIKMHWDADRFLFSSVNEKDLWQVYEIDVDGNNLKQLTNVPEDDLEFFDPAYLPNGKIVAVSNIGYNGVPCVNGSDIVGNLCLYNPENGDLRRLNFGQDNDWNPVVMNNGRLQYLRWEYTDNTHYFSRIMMHMNPDGTAKKELYGSGSYWPNSMFDARPLPGRGNTSFVAIVSGHHGIARSGRLVLFDPKKDRHEEKGVIQEIPRRNEKVEPIIKDRLVDGVWPQFLAPQPLSEKYFLVTAKLSPNSLWGIYLVDVFDNMTLIMEKEGEGFISAVPVKKKPVPPIIPEKVKPEEKMATVYIQDIYEGKGTLGIPRGTIEKLRVFAYEYAYVRSPSNHMAQGIESGWDIKRELGTVPINEDGSVIFKVPANLPFSMQPIDKDGAAVQWMRSWTTAMPGEFMSCVGCHEDQYTAAMPKMTIASRQKANVLTPPEDGVRPFTFNGEIQPVLDHRCIGCHNGQGKLADFSNTEIEPVVGMSKSYLSLHPYVRRQGPEADIHVMQPMEYHVSTSELIKKLRNGHHGVELDEQEWKTLYQWIDFNAPYHGAFEAHDYNCHDQIERRLQLSEKYGNIKVDWQQEIVDYMEKMQAKGPIRNIIPEKKKHEDSAQTKKTKEWSFDGAEAKAIQMKDGEYRKELKLNDQLSIKMVKIPAGSYITENGEKIRVKKAFWMAETEITNEQYNALFPEHDSRFINQFWKDHVNPGYPANKPQQPVIRVSYNEAVEFCKELSKLTGEIISLPSEQQWEWAARSGSNADFYFGNVKDDFSNYANLADVSLKNMAVTGVNPQPMDENDRLRPYYDFIPRSKKVDDGNMVVAEVKQYQSNAFGLYDMVGNVAEWTTSDYCYPETASYKSNVQLKVVKGFSWRDRSKVAKTGNKEAYLPWQKVYNVGFRIIIEE